MSCLTCIWATLQTPRRPKRLGNGNVQFADRYILGNTIGEGSVGSVHACTKRGASEQFAVKIIAPKYLQSAEREADLLSRLAHPGIVKLHDVFFDNSSAYMVLDMYEGGNLMEGMQLHWKQEGMLSTAVVQHLGNMILQGVSWLHQNKIVHRDLKPDNFLMECDEIQHSRRLFLSDFDTAVEVDNEQRLWKQVGTPKYWAPEIYDCNYGSAVDAWAIGVLLYGMIIGRFVFKDEKEVRSKRVSFRTSTPTDGQALILGMLERTEAKRLTIEEALEHRFFTSLAIKTSDSELEDESTCADSFSEGQESP